MNYTSNKYFYKRLSIKQETLIVTMIICLIDIFWYVGKWSFIK